MARQLPDPHQNHAHRVIASLNREQVDYLDKIGKDAQFSCGVKLSRTQLLAAMVNALKRLNLTGDGVSNSKQFEQRIVDAMRRRARETGGPRRGEAADEGGNDRAAS